MPSKVNNKPPQPKKKTPSEVLREQKIESCQNAITNAQETISEMEENRSALLNADVVGLAVTHRVFGSGKIIEQSPSTITVKFVSDSKRFVIPSAF